MNLLKSTFFGAMFSLCAFSAQAETLTPDILSSVSTESVSALTTEEASAVRGEFRACGRGTSECITTWDTSEPFSNSYIQIVWKYKVPGTSFWVSR